MENRRFFFKPLILWLFYALLLLWIVMPHGMNTALVRFCDPVFAHKPACTPDILTPRATNADIIRLFDTADPGSIGKEAKGFAERKDWFHITSWPDWPPGMVTLQTFLYAYSPDVPVGLVLILLECAVWAVVFTQIALLLRERSSDLVALVLPLLLLLTSDFTYYFHIGVFYSESLSTGAFFLGVTLLVQATRTRSTHRALVAGVFFALSTYMRAQTDLVMSLTLILFLLCWGWSAWRVGRPLRVSGWLTALAFALISYHALTMPYRATHGMQMTNMSGSAMWPPTWARKQEVPENVKYYIFGGGMEGCDADPELCDSIHARRATMANDFTEEDYFHFTIQSMVHHPLKWAELKAPYLWYFWMNVPEEVAPWDFWMDIPQESVLQTLLLPLLFIYCLRRKDETHTLLALCLISTMIGIVVPPLISHFEVRYLYQFKLLIFYTAILMMGIRPARDA